MSEPTRTQKPLKATIVAGENGWTVTIPVGADDVSVSRRVVEVEELILTPRVAETAVRFAQRVPPRHGGH
ncbi:MAG TPA: hypothetical protein VM052_09260 [Candidatus Limnocylindrales bacterium]|nr:hypothetical protein [Candidatus Limnocylindrales bacterium]